jgi:hypothetical protein
MPRRALSSPYFYGGWALVVVAALLGTAPFDPYVFAFTALGLAWLTGVVAIGAVAAIGFWGWEWTRTRRLIIALEVGVAVAAVARALAALRTFDWT